MKIMEKTFALCLCLLFVLAFSGCISQVEKQKLVIKSEPKMFIIGSDVDLYNIDPAVGFDYALSGTSMALYDNLYRYVGNPPSVVPWLAERYEVLGDGKEWTFYLRKNAKFHDDSPVTAQAVKYSANRLIDIGNGPASLFSNLIDKDSVIVIDDYTVKFKLLKPFSPFLDIIPWLFIVNPSIVEEHKDDDFGQAWMSEHEAGSGPFTITNFIPGVTYEFKAVEDYWKGWPEQGKLEGFTRRVIKDYSERYKALTDGEVHMIDWVSPEDQLVLRDVNNMVIIDEPGLETYEIKLNNKKGYTSDVHVRKAISYAFDYEALGKIWAGRAELMIGPLPPGSEWVNKDMDIYRLDLDKAKEELSKSSWQNGGFELDYVYVAGIEAERQTGLILKSQLAELNITVNIIPMSWTDAVALFENEYTSPDMFPLYSSTAYIDPNNYLWSGYHSSQAGQWTNPGHYENPEVDVLLEEARITSDKEQRKKLYSQAQQIIVEDAVNIFGLAPFDNHVLSPSLKGYDYCSIMGSYENFYWLRIEE